MVPVMVAATGDFGWLVLSRKKHSKVARSFYKLKHEKAHWNEEARAWFAHTDISVELLDAIEEACGRDRVSYCLPCNTGKPCKAWRGISQSSYIVQPGASDSTEVPMDHPMPEPEPEPEQAPPPPPPPPPVQPPPESRWSSNPMDDWLRSFQQREQAQTQASPQTNPAGAAADTTAGAAAGDRVPPKNPAEQFARGVFDAFFSQQMHDNGIPRPVQEFLVDATVRTAFRFAGAVWERAQGFNRQRSAPLGRGDEMSPVEAARMLQVSLPCTRIELQTAFRKALFVAHPDRGGSDVVMAKINTARSVLVRHMGFS